jgi:hypothetical protein
MTDHDAQLGVNWDTLRSRAEDFPEIPTAPE